MNRYLFTNGVDQERHVRTLDNDDAAHTWIINHLDLSKQWSYETVAEDVMTLQKLKMTFASSLDPKVVSRRYELPYEHHNALLFKFYYDLGGYNYFTSQVRERGYYVSIIPASVSGIITSHSLFGKAAGGNVLVKRADRFNKKEFYGLVELAEYQANQYLDELLANVAEAEGVSV